MPTRLSIQDGLRLGHNAGGAGHALEQRGGLATAKGKGHGKGNGQSQREKFMAPADNLALAFLMPARCLRETRNAATLVAFACFWSDVSGLCGG